MRDPLNQELDDLRAENARLKTERSEIINGLSEILDLMEGLLESFGIIREHHVRVSIRKSRDRLLHYKND